MYRLGDIRHNKADVGKAKDVINFKAKFEFEQGIKNFLNWASSQEVPENYGFEESLKELKEKGFITKGNEEA